MILSAFRGGITVAVLLLAALPQIGRTAAPEDGVRATFARNAEGWSKFDAAQIASTYASDAIWQNPFGVRLEGADQIKSFLVHLFERPGYRSAKNKAALKIQKIRLLNPDVAVVWSEETTTGQIENGKSLGDRHSHYLQVFHRADRGWMITDDMIMDEHSPSCSEQGASVTAN